MVKSIEELTEHVILIGASLRGESKTVGTVESCTAGLIAHTLTSISGASNFFRGGLVTYMTDTKVSLADCEAEDIDKYGVVSEHTAEQMASGGCKKIASDYCVSITGYIGETGGDEKAPNGTFCIGVSTKTEGKITTYLYRFVTPPELSREEKSLYCVYHALGCLTMVLFKDKGFDNLDELHGVKELYPFLVDLFK